jgi:hypothetical protein
MIDNGKKYRKNDKKRKKVMTSVWKLQINV